MQSIPGSFAKKMKIFVQKLRVTLCTPWLILTNWTPPV